MSDLIDELIIHNENGEVIAIDDFKKNYIKNNFLDNEKIYNFLYNIICSDDIKEFNPEIFNDFDDDFKNNLENIKNSTKKIENYINEEYKKIDNRLPERKQNKIKGYIQSIIIDSFLNSKNKEGKKNIEIINSFKIQYIYALYYKFLFKEALIPTYYALCDIPNEYLSQYRKLNKLGFLTVESQIGNCIEDKEYERAYISGIIFKKLGCKLAKQLFDLGYNVILSQLHEEHKLNKDTIKYNLTKNNDKYFTNQPLVHLNNIYQIAQQNSPLFKDLIEHTFSIFISDTKYCQEGVLLDEVVSILKKESPLKESNWVDNLDLN